jgi:hypothetical protein
MTDEEFARQAYEMAEVKDSHKSLAWSRILEHERVASQPPIAAEPCRYAPTRRWPLQEARAVASSRPYAATSSGVWSGALMCSIVPHTDPMPAALLDVDECEPQQRPRLQLDADHRQFTRPNSPDRPNNARSKWRGSRLLVCGIRA